MKFPEKYEHKADDDVQPVLELVDRLAMQKGIDVEKNWHQLHARIHHRKQKSQLLIWIRNIAAILLLPLLGLSVYLYHQTNVLKSSSIRLLEATTASGVRTKITLSDGSEVWLNSGSTLSYPERFTKDKRQVTLSGEAFFKVKSDKDHRFDVQTSDGITVSAYGTEFNVQAYAEEPEIKATLAEGHIQIDQTNQPASQELIPGEQAVYSRHTQQMQVRKANLLVETAWKDGKLVFRRTPMEEIAKQLSRHFNVNIQLQGKEIFDYTYSATFTTETLAEILSLLEKTAPIRCEIIEPQQQSDLAFTRKKVIICKQ
ncbi:MAG: DUF4974 domain-containing protein [Parabacteroides sp.]|nr:DUF4974 domain-containing protein [Parabacteroides sp.]